MQSVFKLSFPVKISVFFKLYSKTVKMLKEILILCLCATIVLCQNNTRVERSDKVSGAKIAMATGLLKLGQVAYNQLGGKYTLFDFCYRYLLL